MLVEKNTANILRLILVAVTAAGITASSIIFNQSFLRIIPIYISLFIMLLQTKVNRYALLIGGINSIFYAFVYFHYAIYASAFYSLLFSFPLQIVAFIRWSKNKYKNSTILRTMSWKLRALVLSAFTLSLFSAILVLQLTGSDYAVIDATSSLLSIFVIVLMMLAFVEYMYLSVLSQIMSIALFISMVANGLTEQVTYLVFSIYSLTCVIIALINGRRIYADQRKSEHSTI